MLLINNQEVEKLFSMKDCLAALEDGYDDLMIGDAVYRPRLICGCPANGPTATGVGAPWKARAARSACSPSA